ncbi:MAG: hypothetical protein WC511_00785 [Candidatus Pacearchaeota archaeon]|jgi:hypothetical protein
MEKIIEGTVWSRVTALERTMREICPYYPECNYVDEQNLPREGKSNYYQRVCRNHPGACEENLDPRFYNTKLSGEEVHELLK